MLTNAGVIFNRKGEELVAGKFGSASGIRTHSLSVNSASIH